MDTLPDTDANAAPSENAVGYDGFDWAQSEADSDATAALASDSIESPSIPSQMRWY